MQSSGLVAASSHEKTAVRSVRSDVDALTFVFLRALLVQSSGLVAASNDETAVRSERSDVDALTFVFFHVDDADNGLFSSSLLLSSLELSDTKVYEP